MLKDYVKKFQLRNPQLYVIGAYIHLDEETPHLHLNFIPWVSGCKRGLETKTSLKAALATRGFVSEGKGNTEWKQWAEAEKDDLALIMSRYGIDWKKKLKVSEMILEKNSLRLKRSLTIPYLRT